MNGLIVIPVFNEERNVGSVLARIRAARCVEPVLVVDDGSTDGTARAARAGGADVIAHPRNLGYAQALQTGIRFAVERAYDYLIFLDGDGQHDPGDVAALRACALANDGPDIVIGSRFVERSRYRAPPLRKVGMLLSSWLTAIVGGRRVYDTTSGFKLLRRRALALLSRHRFGDFHADMIIFSLVAGLSVREVPVHVSERQFGASMYTKLGSARYLVRTLTAIALVLPAARRERRSLRHTATA
ncbi:MAG TPA: glycosyltransferase family 2 protein [Polyangia bacterium]|nr:glycosyltransferase family 2 protein [Polyangia bacterium]